MHSIFPIYVIRASLGIFPMCLAWFVGWEYLWPRSTFSYRTAWHYFSQENFHPPQPQSCICYRIPLIFMPVKCYLMKLHVGLNSYFPKSSSMKICTHLFKKNEIMIRMLAIVLPQ
jgi:hypothetical protein